MQGLETPPRPAAARDPAGRDHAHARMDRSRCAVGVPTMPQIEIEEHPTIAVQLYLRSLILHSPRWKNNYDTGSYI